jgi:hypothetical protein
MTGRAGATARAFNVCRSTRRAGHLHPTDTPDCSCHLSRSPRRRSCVVLLAFRGGGSLGGGTTDTSHSGVDLHGQGQGAPRQLEQLLILLVILLGHASEATDLFGQREDVL